MASLDAIANALTKTIEDYVEDEFYAIAYPADSGHLPAVVIAETGGRYRQDFGAGWIEWNFDVLVMLPRGELSESIPRLRKVVDGTGPNSIPQILLEHPDLGLNDGTDTTVDEVIPGGNPSWNSIPLIGATLKVRVLTDGRV